MSNKEAPKEIYLQYSGIVDDTWSSDKIDDSDTKYIRSDIHEEAVDTSHAVGFRDHALKVQKEIEDLKQAIDDRDLQLINCDKKNKELTSLAMDYRNQIDVKDKKIKDLSSISEDHVSYLEYASDLENEAQELKDMASKYMCENSTLKTELSEKDKQIESLKNCHSCYPTLGENLCTGCLRNNDNYSGPRIDNWKGKENK